MPAIRNEDIEIEARAMLRERIERTPWFQNGMTRKQRQAAIEREVDRTWHLFIFDAAQRLIDRAVYVAFQGRAVPRFYFDVGEGATFIPDEDDLEDRSPKRLV